MQAYLSLGANLGNKEQTLDLAVSLIQTRVGNVIRRSSFFYSAPQGFTSEHQFCNICVLIDTTYSPLDLLHQLQSIEHELGKQTHSVKQWKNGRWDNAIYSDRVIDIDILTYEGVAICSEELTLPHPHMLERDFVMIPLREIS